MSDSRENRSPGINVKAFERIDDADTVQDYIHILDVFDGLAGIQRLKRSSAGSGPARRFSMRDAEQDWKRPGLPSWWLRLAPWWGSTRATNS